MSMKCFVKTAIWSKVTLSTVTPSCEYFCKFRSTKLAKQSEAMALAMVPLSIAGGLAAVADSIGEAVGAPPPRRGRI